MALRGAAGGVAPAAASRNAGRADNAADEPFEAALRSFHAGRFDEATHAFDAIPVSDPNAPDLWAARSVREGKGCRAAVGRFDRTASRSRRTSRGWDALLEGGLCYRALGDVAAARSRFTSLLDVDSHKDRARAELDRLNDPRPPRPAAKSDDSPK
jgi:tetratricopeptide (TPR) repeat protein